MRILLAEDSFLLAEALRALLERMGHSVVSTARTADELWEAYAGLHRAGRSPDLVLTDVRMPPGHGDDGLVTARRIRALAPRQSVLVLSQYIADTYARELLTLPEGGVSYLLKDRVNRVEDFARSLAAVAAGGTIIDPEVVQHLLRRETSPLQGLTPREREVLALMAQGYSNAQIGAELVLSDAAVGKHIRNIFSGLGLEPTQENRRVKAILTYLDAVPPA